MLFKDSNSIRSDSSTSSSIWTKITKLIHSTGKKSRRNSVFSRQTTGNYSSSTLSDESVKTIENEEEIHNEKTKRKPLVPAIDTSATTMVIPPFSPTYCKANEFPYSNFYVKLPDGRWMVRYRDGNREILRTDIMEGYMI